MKEIVEYPHNCKRQANGSLPGLIFLIPSLSGGGAERVASNLLPYLSQHFDVTLALLENRLIHPVPEKVRLKSFSGPLESQTAHISRIPYHILSLARLVRKYNVRVVLSFIEQANILNLLTAFITHHRTVISQRVEPDRQYANKGILGQLILKASRLLYPKAGQVVAVSEGIRNTLISDYGLDPGRLNVIHNPVDIKNLSYQAKAPLPSGIPVKFLLHVGRMRLAHKAQDVILKAFHLLRRKYKDLSLVFVGDGPDRERIMSQVDSLGLNDDIILTGWQDNVAVFMARADVFVLASRYEGWPNVLMEAMACGCPVVATDCDTGPREILGNNEYGLLAPVNNAEALARAVDELLSNKSRREWYKEQAFKRAKDFKLEIIAKKYVELLKTNAIKG
ncbi:MAG: glycosyltransferase [Deltaproteobacteria bacterium]|nr:glycosyltransferase [Deltaproteobacteria bacterium]